MENYTQTPMTAPAQGSNFTKRNDIQTMPHGLSVGIIYSIVHIGNQVKMFNGQSKVVNTVFVGIEYPQLKQLFYMEDTTPRSTVGSLESAFSMAPQAKLRELAEAVLGRKFSSDEEANKFDISQLIGAKVLVMNVVQPSKKTGILYNKITGFAPLGEYPLPVNFNPELEYHIFNIDPAGNNFMSEQYAKLPNYLKKKIMESQEAKDYIARGGQFAKKPENNGQNNQQNGFHQPAQQAYQQQPEQQPQQQVYQQPVQQPVQQQAAPAPDPAPGQAVRQKFVLTDTSYTLDQWKASQWTEQALVDARKGYWENIVPEPVSAPAPPVQTAPAPPVQQAPAQPFNAINQPQSAQQTQYAQQLFDQQMANTAVQNQQPAQFQQPQQQPQQPQQAEQAPSPSNGNQPPLPNNPQQPGAFQGNQPPQNNTAAWLKDDEDDDLPF